MGCTRSRTTRPTMISTSCRDHTQAGSIDEGRGGSGRVCAPPRVREDAECIIGHRGSVANVDLAAYENRSVPRCLSWLLGQRMAHWLDIHSPLRQRAKLGCQLPPITDGRSSPFDSIPTVLGARHQEAE